MQITTFSDYTLRVLIYLATRPNEKTTAAAIAQAYGVSFHHIAKTAQWLSRHGYVASERGRNGGLYLTRDKTEINIGAVLRQTEADTSLVDCMKSDGGDCCIAPSCGLKFALTQAQEAFYKALDQFTLNDITQKQTALSELLGL